MFAHLFHARHRATATVRRCRPRDRPTGFESLESRALLNGQPVTTINFTDLSNLPPPNKIYVGGWINGGQAVQSAIVQVANVVKQSGVTPTPPTPTPSSSLTIAQNTADYFFDPVNPARLTISGTGFGSVPSANTIVFYEDAAGTQLSPVNPNGAAGPFFFSIPDGTDTSLTVAFDATASGKPQPSAGPLYARISTTWAYPLQADGTFATGPSPAVPFYDVASLSGGVSLSTATNGNDRLVFVAAPVTPTATSSQTPWSNYPITVLPQNKATVPPGPFGIMEFGYDAQFNTSYVDSFGLNWSFVDHAAPDVVYGVRSTIDRSTMQTAFDTFTGQGTGTGGDPLGGPFNQLLWTSTTTPVPAVVDGQFTAIVSPKDWLAVTPSAVPPAWTALSNYWTDTVDEFFADGNQLNLSLNGTAYTGTALGGTYTLQPVGVVIAKGDYDGTAIFAQPQPDNSSVAGQLKDAVFEAFSRGVSLDGVWKAGRQGSPPAGYSSDAWTNYPNWYKPGATTYDQNINRTYDVYAKFFHYATSEGKDFRDVTGGKPMLGLNGKGWFAMAYGFSLDESPSVNTAGTSGTWPTDASVNGGTTIGKGGSITVTFGPWSGPTPSAPTVKSIDTRPPQAQPGTPTPTAPGTVTWDVLFNEQVTGVSAANFALVTSAGLSGAGQIQVSQASTSLAKAWTVTASTGTGTGTLGLNLANNLGSIKDRSGHALATGGTGQVYAVSEAPPVGPTATIAIAGTNPSDAASVPFTVTFSQPVTGLTTANFTPVATGSVTGATVQSVQVVPGSGTTYTVTVNTGTGSGTLALRLPAPGTGIAPAPSGLPVTSAAYTIDKNDPTKGPDVQGIALAGPSPTAAASVSWTVTFTEPVTGVTAANFALVPGGLGGTPAITGVTPASGTSTATWTVTASTGTGAGTLGLTMANSTGVADANSQAVTNVPFTGAAYTIDRVAPALQSISRNLPNPTDQPQVSWTVSFSEAVAGVNVNNFNLVSSGLSGARITQVVEAPGTGTAWTVTALTGSGTGSLGLDMVNATGITDAVGLAPTGIPLAGQTYDVQRGDVPGVRVPIAFWAQPGRRTNLVWPRGLVPFTGPANRELTVTLAATGGDGSFAARRGIRGVTVAGTGTGPEISLTGTARNLNAYLRTAGRIGYTPSGESLLPRVLAVSAVTTSDTLAGFDTAAILMRGRMSPGRPTIAPQTALGPTPLDTPLEISYADLLAAANVPAATTRSVEFLLGRVSTGRLEIWDGADWVPVKPRLPRFARSFEEPLLAPGGRIRWTPRAGSSGGVPAFTVRVWDGRLKSASVSQVSVDVGTG